MEDGTFGACEVHACVRTPPPALGAEQRAENLRRAQEARRVRAEALRELKSRALSLEDALADPRLARCKVYTLLKAVPGIGARGARRLMAELSIAPSRRVGGLGRRQRERLISIVGGAS